MRDSDNVNVAKADTAADNCVSSGNNTNWNVQIPVAETQIVPGVEDNRKVITLVGTDADDEPILTFHITSLPVRGTLWQTDNGSTGSAEITAPDTEVTHSGHRVVYYPAENDNGSSIGNFGFRVNDGDYDSPPAAVTVNVAAVNDAPVITGQRTVSVPEDTPLTVAFSHLTVTDVDNSYPSDFTLTVYTGANYAPDEEDPSVILPAPDFYGTLSVPVRVSDGAASSGYHYLGVTVSPVDDAPTLASEMADVTVDEDAAPTVTDLGGVFADIDSDVSAITKTVFLNSNPSLMAADITGDTLTLDYLEDQHGTAEIVIRGTADGKTAENAFTVTVNPVDDAPSVAAEIPDVTADEDADPVLTNLAGVFTDVDSDDAGIVMSLLSDDNPSLVTVTADGDALTLAFQENQSGTAAITVQAESGGQTVTDTFTVTVNPVDDPLGVISGIPDVTADEDAAPATINLDGVFGDIDSDIPAVTETLLSNDNPSLVSAAVTGDTLTLEYQADQHGTAVITVQGEAGGQTAEDTFTVTVNPVDDPPVAENEIPDVTADEDSEETVTDLTGVFSDTDNDDASVAISVQSVSTPSLIAATVVGKTLTLEYRENQNGSATVVILAESGGKTVTDEFVVTVNPVDDPPTISVVEDQITDRNDTAGPVRFTVSDPDGDELTVSADSSDTGLVPDENIILAGADEDRTVTVTPGPGTHGEAVITLTVSDGVLTAEESFVLTVRNVYKISGQVTYFAGENPPISDMLVTLESEDGTFFTEALTDEDGGYTLSGIPPGGHYVLVPSKEGDPGTGAISAEDSSKIARSVVGALEMTEHQREAADVNRNGRVTSVDASDLSRYRVGLIPEMNENGTNWAFLPTAPTYPDLSSDMENQDIAAMVLGDISGNYSPGTGKDLRGFENLAGLRSAGLLSSSSLSVPVVLNGGREIEGIDITIEYDEKMLGKTDVTLAGGILEHEDYSLIANTGDGMIRVAVYALTGDLFTGDGPVLLTNFDIVGTRPGTVLEFTEFRCNETPVSDGHDKARDSGLSGGFYIGGTVSQRLIFGTEYDMGTDDPDGDGVIGMGDAIQALRQGNPGGAIRVLQCIVEN